MDVADDMELWSDIKDVLSRSVWFIRFYADTTDPFRRERLWALGSGLWAKAVRKSPKAEVREAMLPFVTEEWGNPLW
jgi:hypothetical protein